MGGAATILRTLVRDAALRRLAASFVCFETADYGTWVGMLVYSYAHGGATTAGTVALGQVLPAALFAPVAGPLIDRYGAGRVLAVGHAAQALAIGAAGAAALSGSAPLAVYTLGAVATTAITLQHPAQAVVSPRVARTAEQLVALNAVGGWIGSVALVAAPALAGVLLAVASPGAVLVAGGCSYALAGALTLPLAGLVPPLAREGLAPGLRGVRGELADGARTVARGGPAAELLLVILATYTLVGAFDVLAVVLAVSVLGLGGSGAGYLSALHGSGALIGAAASAVLLARRRIVPVIVASALITGAAFVVLGLHEALATAIVLIAVAGVGRSLLEVAAGTLLQRVTPTALLARIFAFKEALLMCGWGLGSIAVPALVGLGGSRLALVAVGLIVPVTVLVRLRQLLRLDAAATVPVVEIALLRSMRIFRALPVPALEGLGHAAERLRVGEGTAVVRQGEEGDRYYAIVDGTLEVDVGGRAVATLERGEGFGEIALLRNAPRMATVTARTDAELLAVEREAFLVALTGHGETEAGAEAIADERLAASAAEPAAP